MSFCRRTYGKANASCHSISGKTVVFAADLIPTAGHINQVYVMGYDTRPLLTWKKKENFLNSVSIMNIYCSLNMMLIELASLKMTEKGVRLDETFSFNDVFGY
jgi:hypothetical protein